MVKSNSVLLSVLFTALAFTGCKDRDQQLVDYKLKVTYKAELDDRSIDEVNSANWKFGKMVGSVSRIANDTFETLFAVNDWSHGVADMSNGMAVSTTVNVSANGVTCASGECDDYKKVLNEYAVALANGLEGGVVDTGINITIDYNGYVLTAFTKDAGAVTYKPYGVKAVCSVDESKAKYSVKNDVNYWNLTNASECTVTIYFTTKPLPNLICTGNVNCPR